MTSVLIRVKGMRVPKLQFVQPTLTPRGQVSQAKHAEEEAFPGRKIAAGNTDDAGIADVLTL